MLRKVTIVDVYAATIRTKKSMWKSSQETQFFLTKDEANLSIKKTKEDKPAYTITGSVEHKLATVENGKTFLTKLTETNSYVSVDAKVDEFNHCIIDMYHGTEWSGDDLVHHYTLSSGPNRHERETVLVVDGKLYQPNNFIGEAITINTDYVELVKQEKILEAKREAEAKIAHFQAELAAAKAELERAESALQTVTPKPGNF